METQEAKTGQRPYETMIVFRTDAAAETTSMIERVVSIIKADGGSLDNNHDWGARRMAYPIRKLSQGHYYLLEYHAGPEVVKEIERNLRLTENVLRYMSVQQEHTGLPQPPAEEEDRRDEAPLSSMTSSTPSTPTEAPTSTPSTPAAPAPTPAAAAPTPEPSAEPAAAPVAEPTPTPSAPADEEKGEKES